MWAAPASLPGRPDGGRGAVERGGALCCNAVSPDPAVNDALRQPVPSAVPVDPLPPPPGWAATMSIGNLLFDLDGTLVDSRGTISAALVFALRRAGVPPPEPHAVRAFIGRPLLDILQLDFALPEARALAAIEDYRAHYADLGREGSSLYQRAAEQIERLAGAGYRLYLATVKPEPVAERVLNDFGLRTRFLGIAGSSLDSSRRYKADIIRHALDTFGLDPARSLMIGDRDEDIGGARRHGLRAVGAGWGYGGMDELRAAGAEHVAAGFDDLADYLLRNPFR